MNYKLWYLLMKVKLKQADPDWLKSRSCWLVDAEEVKTKNCMSWRKKWEQKDWKINSVCVTPTKVKFAKSRRIFSGNIK